MKRGQKLKKCVTQMAWMHPTLKGLMLCSTPKHSNEGNRKGKCVLFSCSSVCPEALLEDSLLTCVE